jgi:hypothetical protein
MTAATILASIFPFFFLLWVLLSRSLVLIIYPPHAMHIHVTHTHLLTIPTLSATASSSLLQFMAALESLSRPFFPLRRPHLVIISIARIYLVPSLLNVFKVNEIGV